MNDSSVQLKVNNHTLVKDQNVCLKMIHIFLLFNYFDFVIVCCTVLLVDLFFVFFWFGFLPPS